MIGAVIGDIAGSRFEWHNIKTKDFEFFHRDCCFTDDTVMSLAVSSAVLESRSCLSDRFESSLIKYMKIFGRRHIGCGYGRSFKNWILSEDCTPYGSWGNGSAMRVSACAYAADTLGEALDLAEAASKVTHNHPEGIKGGQAAASAVFLALSGASKRDIFKYINNNFYNLEFTLDEIRASYTFDVSCAGSVPQAIRAFLESESFEDAVRNAVSIGGDSDTIASVSGSIAEAFYGIPKTMRLKAEAFLTDDLRKALYDFESVFQPKLLEQ